MLIKHGTASSHMETIPLSTKGNAIYGKRPQKNLGVSQKEEIDSRRCQQTNGSLCSGEFKILWHGHKATELIMDQ